MPTPTKGRRLGGSPAHQRHMMANLATALFEHGKITTTEARARRLRPVAERLITFAKRGDLHARRQVLATVTDRSVVHTLFTEIAPSFATREGGYTRITKIGPRKGDNAAMAVIELVPRRRRRRPRRRRARRAQPAAASAPAEAAATAPERTRGRRRSGRGLGRRSQNAPTAAEIARGRRVCEAEDSPRTPRSEPADEAESDEAERSEDDRAGVTTRPSRRPASSPVYGPERHAGGLPGTEA